MSSAAVRTAAGPRATALKLAVPLCALLAWSVATSLRWIPASVLPAPAAVLDTFVHLAGSGELAGHALASLRRVAVALALGSALGVAFGTAVARSARFSDYAYPVFQVLVYVPILAWLPLLMVVLGIGEALKIVLLVKVVFVPVAINAMNAIRDTPAAYRDLVGVFGLGLRDRLLKVYFPAAFIPIWGGIRYGHAKAWAALVIVEMLASSDGLGYLLVEGQSLLQVDVQMSAIVTLVALGFCGDRLLALAYLWKSRWSGRAAIA